MELKGTAAWACFRYHDVEFPVSSATHIGFFMGLYSGYHTLEGDCLENYAYTLSTTVPHIIVINILQEGFNLAVWVRVFSFTRMGRELLCNGMVAYMLSFILLFDLTVT